MKLFHYCTSCVNSNGAEISAMVDTAKEVSYDTILRHCLGIDEWANSKGYGSALKLKHDRHVRYYQSTFQGKECYYIVHSAIEYIWVKHEHKVTPEFQYVQDSIELEPDRDAIHQRAEDELKTPV